MAGNALLRLLDESIVEGCIEFVIGGEVHRVGRTGPSVDPVRVDVADPSFLDRVLTHGNLALGEAYMAGDFRVEGDDLAGFLGVLLRNRLDRTIRARVRPVLALKLAAIRLRNRIRGRFGNIHHHFDLGVDLFEAFLDPSLAYTCGYEAGSGGSTIEELQIAKYERICEKLRVREGDRMADLGCGFGGLLIHAAKHHRVTGVGLTISQDQHRRANERIAELGLDDRIGVRYASYETLEGTFDKIATVGMMEHLTYAEYPRCMRTIADCLTDDGRALIHFIGTNGPGNPSDPFTQKYLFPGAHWPRLSVIIQRLEESRLPVLDVENLIRHYTLTLRRWLELFRANYDRLDHDRYPESFRRMWEYYLCISIAGSLFLDVGLFQILVTKNPAAPMPYQRV